MYEAYFGLSGPPFQLNPDPAFYFNSRGHGHALAYLRYGVAQGEGFIVVTGEIGAGKTTLLRALLDELDRAQVVAAQIVSTQLESGDLLQAIVTAFGIPTQGNSKASLIATLEAFLMTLATQGRRALLIIDEAQNLEIRSIEELRMLSNFQLGTQSLLQSFLVGQPELRKKLESPAMEQLRQRVTASCHLGPLGAEETRAYVEHRLKRVGWAERPRFDAGAFAQIHRWSGGIPRRINRLANRLLLAAFLESRDSIDAAMVEQTAQELRHEIGEGAFEPLVLTADMVAAVEAGAAAAASAPEAQPGAAAVDVAAAPVEAVPAPANTNAAAAPEPASPDQSERPGHPEPPAAAMPEPASTEAERPPAAAEAAPLAADAAPAEDDAPEPALPATVPSEAAAPAQAVDAIASSGDLADAPSATLPGAAVVAAGVADRALAGVAEGDVLPPIVRTERAGHRPRCGVLLCLADHSGAALKVAAILKALDAHADVPKLVLVNPGPAESAWPWDDMESALPAPEVALHLGVPKLPFEDAAPWLFQRFGAVIDEFKPLGLLVLGSSDAVLGCSLVAHKRGIPLLRAEAGERPDHDEGGQVNAGLIEQLADVLLVSNGPEAHQRLYRQGIPAARVYGVPGRLASDVVGAMLPAMTTPYGAFLRHRLPIFLGPRWSSEVDGTAYALVALSLPDTGSQRLAGLIDVLADVHAVPKLIWLADAATRRAIRQWQAATPERCDDIFIIEDDLPRTALDKRNSARVLCSDIRSLPDQLSVLRGAVALLVEPDHALSEAAPLLGIPTLTLDLARSRMHGPADAGAAERAFGAVGLNEALRDILALGEPAAPVSELPEPMMAAAAVGARLRAWVQQRQAQLTEARPEATAPQRRPRPAADRPADLFSVPA